MSLPYAYAWAYVFEKLFFFSVVSHNRNGKAEPRQTRKWLAPAIGFQNRNISPERQDERTKIRHCWRIDWSACRKSKSFLLHFIVWLLFAYFCFSPSSTIHLSGLFNIFFTLPLILRFGCVPCARVRSSVMFSVSPFSDILPFFYDFCCFWINIFASCPVFVVTPRRALCGYVRASMGSLWFFFKWVSFTQTHSPTHVTLKHMLLSNTLIIGLNSFEGCKLIDRI